MKLNPKVTGGLAWAGLALILAVPSAEMLTKPGNPKPAMVASPAKAVTKPADIDPIETASVTPARKIKPAGGDVVEDYVSSGKALPAYISDVPAAPAKRVILPSGPATGTVGTDTTKAASVAPKETSLVPVPYPVSLRPKVAIAKPVVQKPAPIITQDDLADWESGSLADYLQRRGLISDGGRSAQAVDSEFDDDGFFLSDGPDGNRRDRRLRDRTFDGY